MKLIIRASILSLAIAGLVAGFVPTRSANAQAAAFSHQVAASILCPPACGDQTCDIRGTGN